jgi:hypothetical protein
MNLWSLLLITAPSIASEAHGQEASIQGRLAEIRPYYGKGGSRYLAAVPDVNGDGVEEVLVGGPSRKSRAPGKCGVVVRSRWDKPVPLGRRRAWR